jgi:hypothetical protein
VAATTSFVPSGPLVRVVVMVLKEVDDVGSEEEEEVGVPVLVG